MEIMGAPKTFQYTLLCWTRGSFSNTVSNFHGKKNQKNTISENWKCFQTVNFHTSSHLTVSYFEH